MSPIRSIRRALAGLLAPELRSGDVTLDGRRGWEAFEGMVRGGLKTSSGVDVSPDSALGLSAAYACINAKASDIASLPLRVYERKEDGSRVEARLHPANDLLNVSPDDETTAMRFRQAMIGHRMGWGNGYAEIRFGRSSGELDGLELLDPRTEPRRRPQDAKLYYRIYGREDTLPPRRVLHLAGLGFDGLRGYCPITIARETFGLSLAAQQANGSFIGNGSRPGGVIEWSSRFKNKEDRKRFRDDWNAVHRGPDNAGATVVLEPGMKYVPITINPEDAQFLETRQFQVPEVARYFDVPLHRIQDTSQVQLASAGMEQMTLMYSVFNLMPECEAIEQALNLRLLTREERDRGLFIEHNMSAFLRGDMKARSEFYRALRDLGVLSPNQIARLENMNPIGPEGDVRLVPGNMVPLDRAGEQMGATTGQPPAPPQQDPTDAGTDAA